MSFLIPNIFALLAFNLVFIFLTSIATLNSLKIIKTWDISSTTESQYDLEKRNRLTTVIIKYIAVLKIPLFFLFIYASGKMAEVLPGAMCAAGAINATQYGKFLIYCSIFNIYLLTTWLIINFYDSRSEVMPFTVLKAKLIIAIFIALIIETVLFILNFTLVDPTMPVTCCNTIFADSNINLPSQGISAALLVTSYGIMVFTYRMRYNRAYSLINFIFFFIAIISLIQFTGIYVYQMPTHKCPFCMLDDAYEQVGYFFYAFLYLGTVSGLGAYIMHKISGKTKKYLMRTSLLFNTLYFLLSIYYPIRYFILNHTWL